MSRGGLVNVEASGLTDFQKSLVEFLFVDKLLATGQNWASSTVISGLYDSPQANGTRESQYGRAGRRLM